MSSTPNRSQRRRSSSTTYPPLAPENKRPQIWGRFVIRTVPFDTLIRLPFAAILTQSRKLKAAIYLATEGEPIAESRLTVELPEH